MIRQLQYLLQQYYQPMGNSLIRQAKKELKSEQYHWVIKSSMPFSSIVIDEDTKTQGEICNIEYSVLEDEWRIYVLRRNNPKYLVTVYDLIQEKDSICSNSREVSVVIEYIPYRLSDLGGLSFSNGIYIIKSILEGYRILTNNRMSFYLLDETSICFNKAGICKFWINQNLYLSKPHSNRIVSESSFIASLLEIIEMRIDCIKEEYFTMKESNKIFTLQNTLDLVNRFHDPRITCVSSISSMGKYSSPPSVKNMVSSRNNYKSINPERISDQKMSISKYKQNNRRKVKEELNEMQEMEKYKDFNKKNSEPKKLSLSFNKNQRNDYDYTQAKTEKQQMFMSPRRMNALSPFHHTIIDSSRENTHMTRCSFPFYQPINR